MFRFTGASGFKELDQPFLTSCIKAVSFAVVSWVPPVLFLI